MDKRVWANDFVETVFNHAGGVHVTSYTGFSDSCEDPEDPSDPHCYCRDDHIGITGLDKMADQMFVTVSGLNRWYNAEGAIAAMYTDRFTAPRSIPYFGDQSMILLGDDFLDELNPDREAWSRVP
jgi:hypothetical protein